MKRKTLLVITAACGFAVASGWTIHHFIPRPATSQEIAMAPYGGSQSRPMATPPTSSDPVTVVPDTTVETASAPPAPAQTPEKTTTNADPLKPRSNPPARQKKNP